MRLSEAKMMRRVMVMATGLEIHTSEWGQEQLKISHPSGQADLTMLIPMAQNSIPMRLQSGKIQVFLAPHVTLRPRGLLLITKFRLFYCLLRAKALHSWDCIVSVTACWCPQKLQIKYQSHIKVRQLNSINRRRDSASCNECCPRLLMIAAEEPGSTSTL